MILKMLINFVLYLPYIFILSNIYYLYNYKRLDKPTLLREKNLKMDYIYYVSQLLFYIWLVVSIFTDIKEYGIFLISTIFISWLFSLLSQNIGRVISRMIPIFVIICSLLIILTH